MTQQSHEELNAEVTSPGLAFRFRIRAEVAASIPIDDRATGELGFIPITGGNVTGAITGTLTPGGDWCLFKAPDTYRVEARYGFRTDSGAYVDVHNVGVLAESPVAGDGQEQERDYFMTTPVFRTVAPELDWLNRAVFVGSTSEVEGATQIDVFEVLAPGSKQSSMVRE